MYRSHVITYDNCLQGIFNIGRFEIDKTSQASIEVNNLSRNGSLNLNKIINKLFISA